jgi:3'-phosphoadenosine 5'-phosphosulfate sulfotransferase (PAPS reductase)/FAD synthetase
MSDAHHIVCVSGGKDSTALLALAVVQDVPNLEAVFADTGHEHRLTYDYLGYLSDWLQRQGHRPIRTIRADFSDDFARRRDYLLRVASGEIEDRFGKRRHTQHSAARAAAAMAPTGNPFMDLALLKGRFPSTKVRFCSQRLKRNPIIEQVLLPLLGDSLVLSWQGVRAQESEARSRLPECDDVGGGLFNYRPILRWTVADVFEAHRCVALEPNPLYKMGMKRVGCMPCINCGKDELLSISQRFPDVIARVEAMEERVRHASKRGGSTFFSTSDGNGTGIRQVVQWAKTSRGKRN